MAFLIKPNGTVEPLDVPPPSKRESLSVLQEAVGGWIEYVPVRRGYKMGQAKLVVNEEGKLERLAYNPLATILSGVTAYDFIVGPAVLLNGPFKTAADVTAKADEIFHDGYESDV